ncbi:caspase family protein [Roseovarius sp.]|uniref:caspase family protein n=1 Tax=Roseovarius sp. TaxID=1486281 RepID=UPI00260F8772|nr:caspase family protein [Roseovarius sp.]MDM8166716.1 caspase family protein [Roseovarius sp.]
MRVLVAAIVLVIWSSASLAETRIALVIGVGEYDALRPLKNPRNDARSMDETLYDLGFQVDMVTDRDLARLSRALEQFAEDARDADLAVVYFAGHGMEVAGENLLFARDAAAGDVEELKATALPLADVVAAVSEARAGLLLIDACRTDAFGVPLADATRGAFSLEAAISPGLGRIGRADRLVYAFAAAPGQGALDGEGDNSPFAAALVRHLGTSGLELRTALTLVQQDVYDRTRGTQLPYVESGLPGLYFVSATPGELPERERLLLAMAEIDDTVRQDVERVALDADVPLAPLYGALIGSDLAGLDRQQRSDKLTEAASAFAQVRDELRRLRAGDDRVTDLRQQAEEQLALGAFETARAKLTEAAEIDASSRETLKANLLERTLSEAATHYLNGGAAQAELRYQLAMYDYEKALALFAELDDDLLPPDARQQQLAALGALGRINITIGNLPDAARAFEQQLALSQNASARHPDNADLQLTLALSRDNLGDVLLEQGRVADAFDHYRAGHAVREAMAADNPDDEDIRFALSNSYERLGRIHQRQGDLAAAETYFLDKHRLGTRMVAAQPKGYRWQRDLSISDERLGDILLERGDLDGAFAHYRASLDRMIPIRDAHPEDHELKRFTSITLDRLGDVYALQNRLPEARRKFEDSLALRSTLAATDPANADWQYILGIGHERLGDILTRMGDMPAATAAYEAKHAIVTRLSASDPTNVRWLRDLSVADERLGRLAHDRGDLDAAMAYYRQSLDRMTPLRDASPTDMELNRFLSFTQDHLAGVLMDKGDTDAALDLYRNSLTLREKLVATDPQNGDWRFVLGISHELIGNAYMRMAAHDDAVAAYGRELSVMSVLLEQDPENTRWRRVVAITEENLGDAHLAAGNPGAALTQYQSSLARMSKARDAAPDDLATQRFTAVTLRKIGAAHLAAGATDAALTAYSESLAIARRLVEADPLNARWQRDQLVAYKGVSDAGGDAEQTLRLALKAADEMKELGVLAQSDEPIVDALRQRLDTLDR